MTHFSSLGQNWMSKSKTVKEILHNCVKIIHEDIQSGLQNRIKKMCLL